MALTTQQNSLNNLTRSEREVFAILAKGKKNREIAKELWISINTVKTHLQSIYRKLGVADRHEARKLYWRSQRQIGIGGSKVG